MAATWVPEGFHSVTPHLCVADAAGAIDFYSRAFGAVEIGSRLSVPGGKIAHAEIRVGDSILMVSDEFDEWRTQGPHSVGGSPVSLHIYVEDVDATASRAVEAGAVVVIPVADQFYGDRTGRLIDPYGHIWIIATHREDLTPEEIQSRFEEFMTNTAG